MVGMGIDVSGGCAVYRMDEVLETVGRDAKNIDDAVDCIAQRLQYRSSNVKQKSLKLVKYVAQKGSPEFQRGLNRLAPVIRELTHYTCAPDPFKGDIPWKRVQQYAKEALDVIHHGTGDGGSSRSGMVGFGSDQQQSGLTPLSPPTSTAFGTTFSVGLKDIRDSAMEALGSGSSMGRSMGNSMGRSSERPTIRHVAGTTETSSPPSASRYTHEVKAVDRFCSRGSSVRVAPTVEECQTFASSVAGRDGTALAKAMEKNIQCGRWQESLRALCVLDVMSKPDRQRHATDEAILSYFKGHPQALQQATRSAQERVRSKSVSVLSHIGVVEDQAKASNGQENGGLLLLSLEETPHGNDDRPAHHTEKSGREPEPCVLDDMSSLLLDDYPPVQQNEQAVPNSPVAGLVSPSVSNTSGHVHSTTSDPFGDWTEPSPQSNPSPDMFSSQPPAIQQQNITDPFLSIENPQVAANDLLGQQNTAAKQTKATTTSTEDILNMFGSTTAPVLTAPQATTTAQPSLSDSSSAWHAATSGFSSSQREDAAFDFVKSAMADVTKNQAMK